MHTFVNIEQTSGVTLNVSATTALSSQYAYRTIGNVSAFVVHVIVESNMCGHFLFSSQPQRPMTSDFEGFSIPDFIHNIYFPILILEKEPVFSLLNVQC